MIWIQPLSVLEYNSALERGKGGNVVNIVVIGGGFGGCAAAAAARKAGAQVTLLERMEVVGGWARLTGRLDHKYFPLREELGLMGGDDIFALLDDCTLHENVFFPWPEPSGSVKTIFHTAKAESELRTYLEGIGVKVRLQSRASDIERGGGEIRSVILDNGTKIQGDVFIDATGGAGPQANCQKYGNGCAMCFMRCPAFGGRVSIAGKAGVKELKGKRGDGSIGAINGAFALLKESLAPELREQLERKGTVWIPVPRQFINGSYKRTESITASGLVGKVYSENVVLIDIGVYVKRAAGGYAPLDELRKTPGLEQAVYAEPTAGVIGNGVRFMAVTPRGDALNVPGVDNLFVASEKLGVCGVGEVIATGVIAGHNAVRKAVGMAPLILPRTTLLGDFIAYVNERWNEEDALKERFHTYTEPYIRHAEEVGLSTEDGDLIRSQIQMNGLVNVLSQRIAS